MSNLIVKMGLVGCLMALCKPELRIIVFVKRMLKNIMTYLRVIPVITTYYVIEKNIIAISNADGVSMDPTIKSGDIVIIDRFSFRYFYTLKKDDIVVAVQPVNPEISICKRIVEVGGGTVPYGPGVQIPLKHYWLEGDNKTKSYDSRHHGCVPENLILGKVLFVIPI
jgi:signal peptidase I